MLSIPQNTLFWCGGGEGPPYQWHQGQHHEKDEVTSGLPETQEVVRMCPRYPSTLPHSSRTERKPILLHRTVSRECHPRSVPPPPMTWASGGPHPLGLCSVGRKWVWKGRALTVLQLDLGERAAAAWAPCWDGCSGSGVSSNKGSGVRSLCASKQTQHPDQFRTVLWSRASFVSEVQEL